MDSKVASLCIGYIILLFQSQISSSQDVSVEAKRLNVSCKLNKILISKYILDVVRVRCKNEPLYSQPYNLATIEQFHTLFCKKKDINYPL